MSLFHFVKLMFSEANLLSRLVVEFGFRCILLDRLDAVFHAGFACIHFALPNDLGIGGFKHEIRLSVFGCETLEVGFLGRILAADSMPFKALFLPE